MIPNYLVTPTDAAPQFHKKTYPLYSYVSIKSKVDFEYVLETRRIVCLPVQEGEVNCHSCLGSGQWLARSKRLNFGMQLQIAIFQTEVIK